MRLFIRSSLALSSIYMRMARYCAGAFLWCWLGAAAAGTNHALLVGVSEYPALGRDLQLAGPANDVQLFRELLLTRGVPSANMRVLADGVRDATLPTRAAILAALADLSKRVRDGDYVFLMMAGHGSQQPSKDADEADGMDEIFLPRDVGRWDGSVGSVANAITDNEIGAALTKIRERGAFVWGVFDTCHSGTLTRAIPRAGERSRQVRPEALGIDPKMLVAAQARGAGADHSSLNETQHAARGGFVYMYAAQSHETTPESLEPGDVLDAKPQGLFSYTLFRVLSAQPTLSYRQAIEGVMQLYLARGRQSPSPVYEGSALDSAVFGSVAATRVRQWRVDRQGDALVLRAGQLHGVTDHSILALVASPVAGPDAILGYVTARNASAAAAELVPMPFSGKAAVRVATLPASAYARPVDLKVDFRLRVGLPEAAHQCQAPNARVVQALEQLRKGDATTRTVWVSSAQAADVYLCQHDAQLLFLDAAANLDEQRSHYVGIDTGTVAADALAKELGESLTRIARVINLSRVATGSNGIAQVRTSVQWRPGCDPGRQACDTKPQSLDPTSRPVLRDGDTLTVELANTQFQPVDVTVLYIDSTYGISVLYPGREGDLARLEPKAKQKLELVVNAKPSGFERMLVLAAPVVPQAPITDFSSLAQPALPGLMHRGAEQDNTGGLLDLLQEAAFGTGTFSSRGAPARSDRSGGAGIESFAWTVAPRE